MLYYFGHFLHSYLRREIWLFKLYKETLFRSHFIISNPNGRWNRLQFLLNIWICRCNHSDDSGSHVIQCIDLQTLHIRSKETLENMGLGHVKARDIANSSTFHQCDDISGLINKNVNLRLQLVFQHKHFGQYLWCFSHIADSTYTLKFCPGW